MDLFLQIAFVILLIAASVLFGRNVAKIKRYINLGRDTNRSD